MAEQLRSREDRDGVEAAQELRIGHGYDLHRLEPIQPEGAGRPLVIGGVVFAHDRGPVSHSDGDVLLHAVTDAILGALALPDIGQLFPDASAENAGRDSAEFLAQAVQRMLDAGYRVANLDTTVILERPKLGPRKAEIRERMAAILEVDAGSVNVKGKTGEGVGPVGEGRAVEAHAAVLLRRTEG